MWKLPLKVAKSLESRKEDNAFRELGHLGKLVDLSSNDYLGFSFSEKVIADAHEILVMNDLLKTRFPPEKRG